MKILVNGAAGAMGLELCRLLQAHYAGGEVAALVDPKGGQGVYPSFSQVPDVQGTVLDFSFHTATGAAVDYAVDHGLPLVVGTTGHTQEERDHILAAASRIPLFYSGNMSLGIAVLCRLVKDAVRFFPQADVEILEVHHNRKADAPSGTALMLAEAVRSQRPEATVLCGRSGASKRSSGEIGISSVRLGNTVGIHEVMISTGTQTLTLKHEAHDRGLLAQGALDAAAFLQGKAPGLYTMEDLVK